MAKKSNHETATLRKNSLPQAEAVVEAKEERGAAARAIAKQLESDQIPGTNSSPKARATNYWGGTEGKK